MNKIINLYQKAKTTAKFVWRYLFTLGIAFMVVSVFVQAPVNWTIAFTHLCIAVFVDWAKMRVKFSSGCYSAADIHQEYRRREAYYQNNNPCTPGTGAYHLTNLGHRS